MTSIITLPMCDKYHSVLLVLCERKRSGMEGDVLLQLRACTIRSHAEFFSTQRYNDGYVNATHQHVKC